MPHDIDKFFVTTGLMATSLLVIILTGIQILVSSADPSFSAFLATFALLNFIFLLGALVLSATSWTESNRNAVILGIVLTLISILIYNFAVGGAAGIWNGSTAEAARLSALNWIIDIALTIIVTGGVFYARIRWKK